MIEIVRKEDGTHEVDGRPFIAYGVESYKKKVTARAVCMPVSFSVQTLEGTMSGKAGDWLMIGAQGEMYPCDAEIFADTYELAQ